MKRILICIACVMLFGAPVRAEIGLQEVVESTIGADATPDAIQLVVGDPSAQWFTISSRGGVTWYYYKTASSSTYKTLEDGAELTIGFDKAVKPPYVFGYGISSSGSLVIEILPFNK